VSFVTLESEGHFVPPSPEDFRLPPVFGESVLFTKPFFLMVLSAVIVLGFFLLSSRNASIVPSRLQFAGEAAYGFVRNSLGRDIIGTQDFQRFVPYLVGLFFFILVNNYFALIPLLQFPTLSLIGFVYVLGIISWLVYNGVGVARYGFLGYLRRQSIPSGMKGPIILLVAPFEFLSNILVRPVTLTLRLWANLFAGHILLLLFALGGEHLITEAGGAMTIVGFLSLLMGVLMSFLEILVLGLQAYIFTLLTSMYISSSLAEEH
jgi:F-type H+-transporting ATPase subunit a